MKYELDRGAHSVYKLQYHLVQVVKYRRKGLTDDKIIDFLKQKIKEISETFEVTVINIETDEEHFHLIFKAKPHLISPNT